ncbi:MAG: S41 family peptidase [Carbonactinosporaceae bacterium]
MSTIQRRVLRGTTFAAAVAMAYVGGLVTGVVGSRAGGPPPEDVGIVGEAAARIESRAARAVDRRQLERAAVEGMVHSLGDRWSSFYEPSEYTSFKAALDGSYTGVGLWLGRAPDGHVEVAGVRPDSPAAGARITPGDDLLSVGDREVTDRSIDEVIALLRGEPGSTVQVTLRHDGERRAVTLPRATLSTEDVTVEKLEGEVLRVQVASFTRGVGRQVHEAMAQDPSAHRRGVILDLRGNPGGLLDEAVAVSSVFLDGGRVVSYESRDAGRHTLAAASGGDSATPLVVLVDGDTASAAEIVTAAVQDRNRGVIVGSTTYGKGSVQQPDRLSDGSALQLTVGRYRTPSGRTIDKAGVEPDVLVDPANPPAVAERRALEVLSGLFAALGTGERG